MHTGELSIGGRVLPVHVLSFKHFLLIQSLLLYIQLLVTTFSSNSVDLAVHAIHWAHCLARLPSPKDSPIVQTVKEAAKRINGASLVHRRVPVSPDMIRQLIICSTLHNPLELRIVCIFVLAPGFFNNAR